VKKHHQREESMKKWKEEAKENMKKVDKAPRYIVYEERFSKEFNETELERKKIDLSIKRSLYKPLERTEF
jgi:hypothetical protein